MRVFGCVRYLVVCLCTALVGAVDAHEVRPDNSWWWDNDWWFEGQIETPENHGVVTRQITIDVQSEGEHIEMPVTIARPDDDKDYPGVLFVHGRAGFTDLIKLHAKRVAARGFVVFAPDLYSGRFIAPRPIRHDYVLEADLNGALDHFLSSGLFKGKRVCAYSHTRGGYYTLKLAVTHGRQDKDLACYVSYYPHWQDPNAPEPMQVYRYAGEVNELVIPTMVFIGDEEQYQRRRIIEMGVKALEQLERPAQLVIYPGVGRGFDFRPEHVRTFADDLASKDAVQRAARFMRRHLSEDAGASGQ